MYIICFQLYSPLFIAHPCFALFRASPPFIVLAHFFAVRATLLPASMSCRHSCLMLMRSQTEHWLGAVELLTCSSCFATVASPSTKLPARRLQTTTSWLFVPARRGCFRPWQPRNTFRKGSASSPRITDSLTAVCSTGFHQPLSGSQLFSTQKLPPLSPLPPHSTSSSSVDCGFGPPSRPRSQRSVVGHWYWRHLRNWMRSCLSASQCCWLGFNSATVEIKPRRGKDGRILLFLKGNSIFVCVRVCACVCVCMCVWVGGVSLKKP